MQRIRRRWVEFDRFLKTNLEPLRTARVKGRIRDSSTPSLRRVRTRLPREIAKDPRPRDGKRSSYCQFNVDASEKLWEIFLGWHTANAYQIRTL